MPLQHLINHVSLVVDKSGSMDRHASKVVEVFDRELNALKQRSVDAHQETRISIYLFDDKIEVLTFDMDVMRFTSLKDYYKIGGSTALIDATMLAVNDNRKLPELYGDHAFLLYVITDGQENMSRKNTRDDLSRTLTSLPDNWTTGILVPDKEGVRYAQQFGFNAGSIATWNTTGSFDVVGKQFESVMTNYMDMRSKGVRSTKSLFTLDAKNLASSELNPLSRYQVFQVDDRAPIKDFVEKVTKKPYRLGSTYHQPVKTIKLQDYKEIIVQNTKTGQVYWNPNIRTLLGLPNDTVSITPQDNSDWRIYVQSTSTNRVLFPGSYIVVTG